MSEKGVGLFVRLALLRDLARFDVPDNVVEACVGDVLRLGVEINSSCGLCGLGSAVSTLSRVLLLWHFAMSFALGVQVNKAKQN